MKERLKYSDGPILHVLQYVVFGSVILYFGRTIFIPIAFALLISFILYPVCAWMEKKGVHRLWATILAISVLMSVGLSLLALLAYHFGGFIKEWPVLQGKLFDSLYNFSTWLIDTFGITKERQQIWIDKILNQSGAGVLGLLPGLISSSSFSALLLVLVPIYSVLILHYRSQWIKVLYRIFPWQAEASINNLILLTVSAYYKFIGGMAIVYILVGILNSVGLLMLGVPHAILFGFIASILTFIPYVGIMVGSLLPIAVAWITYDSIWYPVGVAFVFAFVQYLEANVIFPFAVSQRLNVNTLVMLLAIFAGGVLWGVAGMILFVPLVGILKLIADHNPGLQTISMMLGKTNKK
jgi:predicted PurR-regulated permease PerM